MREYHFLTTWCLREASLESAFAALRDCDRYPEWWPGVLGAEILRRGGEDHVGDVVAIAWRSRLPYTLRFELELVRSRPPHLLEAVARGDLEGSGTWRLYAGAGVAVVFEWRVRTTKPWMNVLAPLARPAFVWNHDLVMRRGAGALAERLQTALVASS